MFRPCQKGKKEYCHMANPLYLHPIPIRRQPAWRPNPALFSQTVARRPGQGQNRGFFDPGLPPKDPKHLALLTQAGPFFQQKFLLPSPPKLQGLTLISS